MMSNRVHLVEPATPAGKVRERGVPLLKSTPSEGEEEEEEEKEEEEEEK